MRRARFPLPLVNYCSGGDCSEQKVKSVLDYSWSQTHARKIVTLTQPHRPPIESTQIWRWGNRTHDLLHAKQALCQFPFLWCLCISFQCQAPLSCTRSRNKYALHSQPSALALPAAFRRCSTLSNNAAFASALCHGATNPASSGLGGGGRFLLVHSNWRRRRVSNGKRGAGGGNHCQGWGGEV